MKVNSGCEITVFECLPLLYDSGSWRSTLEVKSLSLNPPPPYYMTVVLEGQHWKWNHCPWMSHLLYDRGSWRSTQDMKSMSFYVSPTIWQWLMKVNTGSEITVLECLPYYMTETYDGQHWKWNHCPWMPHLLYDSGSWRSTLEVKSLSLNASPTIWQRLIKSQHWKWNQCHWMLPYHMTVAHEGQHWKWNHCPWMSPQLYDRGSWRSTLEVKSLSLNVSPTIWQSLMKVNTGSEITVHECLSYYMTGANEGQHWKLNRCTWMPPLLYDSGSWRSILEVKSLSLNASATIW